MSIVPRTERVTVHTPCDVFSVRVRLGQQETLTPLEQVVLRAVHAGAGTLHDLVRTLGLSQRLALDLVQELRHGGYLRLVRSYAGIAVTPQVARIIAEGGLEGLKSAETTIENRQVMLDKLSGHVLPVRRTHGSRQRTLTVPLDETAWQLADAGTAALVAALEQGLADEERTRDLQPGDPLLRPRRILGAFVDDWGKSRVGRAWLPLEIRAAVDPDTDEVSVVVEDDSLPLSYRLEAGRRITALIKDHPDHEFSRSLRGRALPGLLSAPTLESASAALVEQASSLVDVPGQRSRRHGEFVRSYRQISDLARERVAREAVVEVVAGNRHRETLAALLRQAQRQIVLVGPWLRHAGVGDLETALGEAIRRGVQVVVLWGIRYREDEKDSQQRQAENLLYRLALDTKARTLPTSIDEDELSGSLAANMSIDESDHLIVSPSVSGRTPWLLAPKESARTHAKVAIVDDRAVLVTSWNFLSSTQADGELGVVLRARERERAPLAIDDMLRWVRYISPRYDMSRLLLVESLNREDPASTKVTAHLPADPDPPADEGTEDDSVAAARVWAEVWSNTAATAVDWIRARDRPPAWLVTDGGHRDVLWTALRDASQRLVVTSDQLSSQVIGPRFLQALEAALGRGVQVDLVYGRPADSDIVDAGGELTGPSPAEQALKTVSERFARLRVTSRAGSHAKVLVWDDQVVVGSFNFLSHEGTYSGRSAHRQRSELSVRIIGAQVSDEVIHQLGLEVAKREPVVRPAPTPIGPQRDAQELLAQVALGNDPSVVVNQSLQSSADPWGLLEYLGGRGPRKVVRTAASACLAGYLDRAPLGARRRWMGWLINDLWEHKAYLEAAVLREVLDEPKFRPRPHIAELAAARGTQRYAAALEDAWLSLDAPPVKVAEVAQDDAERGADTSRTPLWKVETAERRAVVAAALERLLFEGDQSAAEILSHQSPMLHDPNAPDDEVLQFAWRTVVDAATAYAHDWPGLPLPMDVIRAELTDDGGAREIAALWTTLRLEVSRAASTQMPNTHTQRTLVELFRNSDGIVARLARIAEEEDPAQLAEWVASAPRSEGGWNDEINAAERKVDPGKPSIHSTHRRKLMRDLKGIGRIARRLAARTDALARLDSAELAERLAAARRFADTAVELLPQILAVDPRSGPEQSFARHVLSELNELDAWVRVNDSSQNGELV